MPTELVLLCETDPPSQVIDEIGSALFPGGRLLEYGRRSARQWQDLAGQTVLSVLPGRPIRVRVDADRAVVDGTGGYGCWVEMTVPFGDPSAGCALAGAVADAVGGKVAVLR